VQPPLEVDFETALEQLNEAFFFREFTFSSNTFRPSPRSELELADAVVLLDDLLIIYQVKQRHAPPNTKAETERRWFSESVLKKATSQIRDTLSYLETYSKIELRNNRGHVFNIARARATQTHKLVIYDPHPLLPTECALKKYHRSKTAGVVHVIHSGDYFGVLSTLITPVEIAEYLAFREALVNRWGEALSAVNEKALVGQYIRNLPTEEPSDAFEKIVDEVRQKDRNWDISTMIHIFAERRTTPHSSPMVHYKVVKELAKLYRTEMAEFKKRFQFSMKKAQADEHCVPHRFTTSEGCGFVFIPLRREDLPYRRNALLSFTALNKYDQRLAKCVGLTFTAEGKGSWCDVQWCHLESPWKENGELQAALDENYPFRPVKAKIVERYGLSGTQ
jgi:hypothetical protein